MRQTVYLDSFVRSEDVKDEGKSVKVLSQ